MNKSNLERAEELAVDIEDGQGDDDGLVEEILVLFGDEDVAEKHDGRVFATVFAGVNGVLEEDDGLAGFAGSGCIEGFVFGSDKDVHALAGGGGTDVDHLGVRRSSDEFEVDAEGLFVNAGFFPAGLFGVGEHVLGRAPGGLGEVSRSLHAFRDPNACVGGDEDFLCWKQGGEKEEEQLHFLVSSEMEDTIKASSRPSLGNELGGRNLSVVNSTRIWSADRAAGGTSTLYMKSPAVLKDWAGS